MKPLMTLFTAPKPFVDPHIATIQMNAICSWKALGDEVAIILIGDEEGVQQAAAELGVGYEANVERNRQGTPLISSIFKIGRNFSQSPLLAYVNADIILLSDFLEAAKNLLEREKMFLIVGQRYDLEISDPILFKEGWEPSLKREALTSGKLHPRGGSDYFIYPRSCFTDIPDFAVGRAGWDNWMLYHARKKRWKTIDATPSIFIIHQNHDYAHLPGGQAHYRVPETFENVRLAGGNRTIFTLQDADYEFRAGRLQKYPSSWKKFWREVEIFPLIVFHSKFLANIFFFIFHPNKASLEFRKWWLGRRKKELA